MMSPDEELECARSLEVAEVEHWVALLSYVPVAEPILECLECDINEADNAYRPDVPQIEGLQDFNPYLSKAAVKAERHSTAALE